MMKECLIKFLSPLTDTLNNGSLFLSWQSVSENVSEKTKILEIRISFLVLYIKDASERKRKKAHVLLNSIENR